ncbi:MAG: PE family protein [Mycobacterium sp.]|uniref:PE family protein n=1 Tax=Mycobacterium sp. TaxID=1785 RepID=UPI003F95443F
MSYLVAAPEAFTAAASDLAGLGAGLETAAATAAPSTTSLMAAAQDEVSTAIAALFGTHGQQFQALSAQAATFHDQFVGRHRRQWRRWWHRRHGRCRRRGPRFGQRRSWR